MTERKPSGASWESWIEAQTCRQGSRGLRQPAGGRLPLPDRGQDYDPLWWVKQLIEREQLSVLPPALELARKVEKELAAIETLHDEAAVRRRVAALNAEIGKLNATVVEGPPTRLGPLDVDRIIARWRQARAVSPR